VAVNVVEAVEAVLEAAPDALVVSSLGTATSALRLASGDGPHLYLGGSMGAALSVALGVAEQVPGRQVVALLGDGELLMGASSLWSLAGLAPANLIAVVLVDGAYAITGGQSLVGETRFAEVAAALPNLLGVTATTRAELVDAVATAPRPAVVCAMLEPSGWPGPSPFVDPHAVRARFAAALDVSR
jgi:thiamine pyrophosphate-dependent acetolactate synthase large subunit-like protein